VVAMATTAINAAAAVENSRVVVAGIVMTVAAADAITATTVAASSRNVTNNRINNKIKTPAVKPIAGVLYLQLIIPFGNKNPGNSNYEFF